MSKEDDRGQFNFSRRKLLGSVATLGAAGAIGGAGTMAFFSDEEEFANNQLTAGELDMKVDYSAHYSDWSIDENDDRTDDAGGDESDTDTDGDSVDDFDIVMWDGAPDTVGIAGDLPDDHTGFPANDAWLIAIPNGGGSTEDFRDDFMENTLTGEAGVTDEPCVDDTGTDAGDLAAPVIDLEDVKPGDFGEVTFSFRLCDNPGYVWLQGELVSEAENGVNEAEGADGDEEPGVVELPDVVQAAYWIDDGNNWQNGSESPIQVGSLRDVLTTLNTEFGAALPGPLAAEDGGGTGGQGCFDGDTEYFVAFAWWVPVDHGNEIQTDSVTFDLSFYTEQCRHNDGSGQSGFGNQG